MKARTWIVATQVIVEIGFMSLILYWLGGPWLLGVYGGVCCLGFFILGVVTFFFDTEDGEEFDAEDAR